MRLVPWQPMKFWWDDLNDLGGIQNQINRIFNSHLSGSGRNLGILEGSWSPAVDIYESKDNILVRADLPGVAKDAIEISVEGDVLVIKGEKKVEPDKKEEEFVKSERFYGAFNRALTLPAEVDSDRVKAVYKNGVLELTLPKKEEVKPKQIKVQVE